MKGVRLSGGGKKKDCVMLWGNVWNLKFVRRRN